MQTFSPCFVDTLRRTYFRSCNQKLTVWQGTVSGFMLGAVKVVCLVWWFRCSSQSCWSCLLKQTTCSLSNMQPAGMDHILKKPPQCIHLFNVCFQLKGKNCRCLFFIIILPESSKAFLWLSESSKGVTVIPLKGSLPCEKKNQHFQCLTADLGMEVRAAFTRI